MAFRLKEKDWRMQYLYYIVDRQGKKIVFKRNAVQQKFNEEKGRKNIVLKSRQLGFTTDAVITMLDDCIFNNNLNCVVIAHDQDSLQRIFFKASYAWMNFPIELKSLLKIDVIKSTQSEMVFNNGSRLAITLSTRSDTVQHLHVSEFGKICAKYPLKAREIITGAFPSVPVDGTITIESTAEGEDGEFYNMFWEAFESESKNENDFKAFFFNWTNDPDLKLDVFDGTIPDSVLRLLLKGEITQEQANWYASTVKIQKELMKQEYPSTPYEAFVTSGRKVIDSEILEALLSKVEKGTQIGDWTYFEKYKTGHRYALGADVAEGLGIDSSTCVIMDFTPNRPKIVARYRSNKIAPDIFAFEIASGGQAYGNCLVAIERNNAGRSTIDKLKTMYSNLYCEIRTDSLTDKQTEKLGWHTNSATKPKMVFDFKNAIEDNLLEIPDQMILIEARKFDQADISSIRFDPESTRHFDVFIAACIVWQMKDHVGQSQTVRMVEESLTNRFKIFQ